MSVVSAQTMRQWREKSLPQVPTPQLIEAAEGMPVLAKLLALRGITDPTEAQLFLNPDQVTETPPSDLPDMDVAVERILKAIEAQESILVYGDFDVDGVTGTTVLTETLTALEANVSWYIPDRATEGHGLNTAALIRLVSARQVKLVITTDTGVTNFNEVNLLKGLGVDCIITDHHELPENLPLALAVVNPKRLDPKSPVYQLAGVGVAYKLAQALVEATGHSPALCEHLLDVVAIGTIVDMVPLLQENRYLAWRGLQVMARRERPGVRMLLDEAGVNTSAPINSTTIGFTIGPRLNAIGRLAKADDAVNLLLAPDDETARPIAAKLEHLNRQRREMVDKSVLEADQYLMRGGELTDRRAVIICSPDWGAGIVGLMASRLVEKYHRPAFVGYIDTATQEARFSARSVEGFPLHHHLANLEDLFIRWGGHSGAAGFSVLEKNLGLLKTRLHAICQEHVTDAMMSPVTTVDLALEPSQLSPHLVDIVDRLAPFGASNPMPVFGLKEVSIGAQRRMGDNQQHLKVIWTHPDAPGQHWEGVQWNRGGEAKLDNQARYRLAFTVEINTYNGANKLQLLMKDIQDESRRGESVVVLTPQSAGVSTPASSRPSKQPQPLTAAEPAAETAEETESGPQWIDHRGRPELDMYFLHTVLPRIQAESAQGYRIFCEGTQTGFPVPVSGTSLCKRFEVPQPVSSLVLWDFPPDMAGLLNLIEGWQPEVIHLVGGKYLQVPMFRSANDMVAGLYQLMARKYQPQPGQTLGLPLTDLGQLCATSTHVLHCTFAILEAAGVVSCVPATEPETLNMVWTGTPLPDIATLQAKAAWQPLQEALGNVNRFREWLMNAPAPVIKSVLAAGQESPWFVSSLHTAPSGVA